MATTEIDRLTDDIAESGIVSVQSAIEKLTRYRNKKHNGTIGKIQKLGHDMVNVSVAELIYKRQLLKQQ